MFPRRLLFGIVPLLLTGLVLVSSGCARGEGIEIALTADQLQRIVDAVFPLDGAGEAVGVALSEPAVTIPSGGERISFGLDIAVSVVLEPGEGPLAARAEERQEAREQSEPVADAGNRGARARGRIRGKAEDAAAAARDRVGEQVEERTADRDPTLLTGTITVSSGVRYANETGSLFLDDVAIERLDIDQLPQRFNQPVINASSAVIGRTLQQIPIYEIDEESVSGRLVDTLLQELTIEGGALRVRIGFRSSDG